MFQIVHTIIFDRRELLFWLCIYENWILCLQFYVSDDWKNFLQTSFWLDTFQTLSYHDTTWDPAPSCHVAGWVGTVRNKEYSWKPFLWEDEQYFNHGRHSKTHHWTHKPKINVFPKSMYSQLLYQTSKMPAVSLMPPDPRGVWQGSQNGERQCLNQLWLKSI